MERRLCWIVSSSVLTYFPQLIWWNWVREFRSFCRLWPENDFAYAASNLNYRQAILSGLFWVISAQRQWSSSKRCPKCFMRNMCRKLWIRFILMRLCLRYWIRGTLEFSRVTFLRAQSSLSCTLALSMNSSRGCSTSCATIVGRPFQSCEPSSTILLAFTHPLLGSRAGITSWFRTLALSCSNCFLRSRSQSWTRRAIVLMFSTTPRGCVRLTIAFWLMTMQIRFRTLACLVLDSFRCQRGSLLTTKHSWVELSNLRSQKLKCT